MDQIGTDGGRTWFFRDRAVGKATHITESNHGFDITVLGDPLVMSLTGSVAVSRRSLRDRAMRRSEVAVVSRGGMMVLKLSYVVVVIGWGRYLSFYTDKFCWLA